MEDLTSAEIRRQFDELAAGCPGLALSQDAAGAWTVAGALLFRATFQDTTIEDTFAIKLQLPHDYPAAAPVARETGGRIPKEFHTNPDGTLCLGTPFEVRMKFEKEHRLLPFVDNLVIPYLFSFRFWKDHGRMPFGEFSHGGKGILENYQELLHVQDRSVVFGLLRLLGEGSYRGHLACPCESGSKLRDCHGAHLLELKSAQSPDHFLRDIGSILLSLSKDEFHALNRSALSLKLLDKVEAASSSDGPRN